MGFKLYVAIDQIPLSASISGSTPFWATPRRYKLALKATASSGGVGINSGSFQTLEAATASAERFIDTTTASSFVYGGSSHTFSSKKGFELHPKGFEAGGKFRHACKGVLTELNKTPGEDAKNYDTKGFLKYNGGAYLVRDESGNIVYSSVVKEWDLEKASGSEAKMNAGEVMFGDPRNKKEYSTIGKVAAPGPPTT